VYAVASMVPGIALADGELSRQLAVKDPLPTSLPPQPKVQRPAVVSAPRNEQPESRLSVQDRACDGRE